MISNSLDFIRSSFLIISIGRSPTHTSVPVLESMIRNDVWNPSITEFLIYPESYPDRVHQISYLLVSYSRIPINNHTNDESNGMHPLIASLFERITGSMITLTDHQKVNRISQGFEERGWADDRRVGHDGSGEKLRAPSAHYLSKERGRYVATSGQINC
jgi:hypothetical protein